MKLIRELQESRFDPAYSKPGQEQDDVRELLDAVAKSIPFIGYEGSGAEEIHDAVAETFRRVAGVDWHKWRKTGEGDV